MAGATAVIGAPIVRKDSAERVVTAPVLVPGEPDRERHQYRAENIREIAQSFLPSGEIDAMHVGGEVGYPIESWVAKQDLAFDGRTVPKGAWLVSAKVTDDDVWAGVADGTYSGVSVFGPIRRVLDESGDELDLGEIAVPVGQAGAPAALANNFGGSGITHEIPPAPVGTSWTVEFERATHVSIVDDPAVQAASFVVAKSAGGSDRTEQLVMEDDVKERFDDIQAAVQKSAEQAEAAAESAEQAQTAAEQAGGGSDGGGGTGGSDELTTEGVRTIVEESVEETVADALADIGDGGGGTGGSDDPDFDFGDADLDAETIEALTEAGAIDEETANALDAGDNGVEKRLAAIEKFVQQGGGRRGAATQLDGESEGNGIGGDNITSGIRAGGSARGDGGEDE